ncbi:LysR family transcriptional regulator [Novosphingobium barchaimii LL02]|uniref:LysR family transcriptional regulator n=1 Tax=Novosphingobium barchaimii LL02 TaxID=1114963 RepID=A0A0J7XYI4_9SPHN|nr:LysR substrate-binding domain-containing protein [Novosphingobium barchaimii]KMS56333.1 LysR family transcriptional regulator [Novosphingobium barchaimii LL02]
MLTIRQIEIFRGVMITKTVSGAARMLGTSQPGLSRMLGHMEDKLRFRLFDRTRGRLVPTPEARVLFDEIEQIYKGFSDLEHIVQRLAKGEDRTFAVGASPSLGHSMVPQMLSRLTGNYPGLTIQFDILSVEQAVDWLALQRGDYAMTVFPIDHPNVLSSRIGSGRMVCAVPAGHPLAERERITVADIRGERIQSFRRDTPHGRIIAQMYADAGEELEVATYVRFAETAVAFVANGMGIALVDSFTAMQAHADTVRFLEFETPGVLPVYVSRNLDTARTLVGETFEEIARNILLNLPRAPALSAMPPP